jgi:hypothetical protein
MVALGKTREKNQEKNLDSLQECPYNFRKSQEIPFFSESGLWNISYERKGLLDLNRAICRLRIFSHGI